MTAPQPSPQTPEEFAKYIRSYAIENSGHAIREVAARDAALLAPLRAEVERLTAEVARLRDALAFYANPDTYRSPSSGFALQYDPMPKPIEIDHGGRAARALAEGGGNPSQKL